MGHLPQWEGMDLKDMMFEPDTEMTPMHRSCINLLTNLLRVEPDSRISISQVLKHDFFSDLDKNALINLMMK